MGITMSKGWFLVVLLVAGLGGGAATGIVMPSRAEIENAVRQAYESSARECDVRPVQRGGEYVDGVKAKGY